MPGALETAWLLPPWATLLLVLITVAFVAAIYRRDGRSGKGDSSIFAGMKIRTVPRTLLAALRLGAIAIVLLMIAQVTLSLKRTGLPYVAVILDDSQSMTIVDDYAPKLHKEMIERLKESGLDKADAGPPPSPLPMGEGTSRWGGSSTSWGGSLTATPTTNPPPSPLPMGEGTSRLSRWNLARLLLAERDGNLLRGIADEHKLRFFFLTGVRPSRRQNASDIVEEIRSFTPKGESTRLGGGVAPCSTNCGARRRRPS